MKHECKLAESIWKYNLFCVSNQNKKITGHIDLDKWTCKATKKFHDTWNKYGNVKIYVWEGTDLAFIVC